MNDTSAMSCLRYCYWSLKLCWCNFRARRAARCFARMTEIDLLAARSAVSVERASAPLLVGEDSETADRIGIEAFGQEIERQKRSKT